MSVITRFNKNKNGYENGVGLSVTQAKFDSASD